MKSSDVEVSLNKLILVYPDYYLGERLGWTNHPGYVFMVFGPIDEVKAAIEEFSREKDDDQVIDVGEIGNILIIDCRYKEYGEWESLWCHEVIEQIMKYLSEDWYIKMIEECYDAIPRNQSIYWYQGRGEWDKGHPLYEHAIKPWEVDWGQE